MPAEANRMLVTKALPHDVALLAFVLRLERKSAGSSRITLSHIFIKDDVSEGLPRLLYKRWRVLSPTSFIVQPILNFQDWACFTRFSLKSKHAYILLAKMQLVHVHIYSKKQ